MLSFATEFPVRSDRQPLNFISCIMRWILGSPHTAFSESELAPMLSEAEWVGRKRNESIHLLHFDVSGAGSAAVRYVRHDNDLQWTTTIVFSSGASDALVATRVMCESTHPAVRLPQARKPVVLRVILEDLEGGVDGPLQVMGSPHLLRPSDIGLAADLLLGKASCRLPVVYLSAGFHGEYLLDPNRLANDLAGMAHVVVEPDRPFSLRLKLEVASVNVYGGTVGIYWPDGGGRRSFFLGDEHETPGDIARAVFAELRAALVNRRPLHRCTWAAVQEAASRSAFEFLRSSGSQEVDRYIEQFDREVAAKQEKIDDAEREIQRLRNDLAIFEARQAAVGTLSLNTGAEQDLYPNEILSFLREALQDAIGRVPSDSRRQHVLQALLAAMPEVAEPEARRERLKGILRDFRGLDRESRKELQSFGFEISEDGKHVKVRFQGDDRYTFTLPKSGSDHRGGLNAASDIGRLLF